MNYKKQIYKETAQYPQMNQKDIEQAYTEGRLQDIINSHLRYEMTVSSQFEVKYGFHYDFEDIYNQSYLTLVKVVNKYSPFVEKKIKFTIYLSNQLKFDFISYMHKQKTVETYSYMKNVKIDSLDAMLENENVDGEKLSIDKFLFKNELVYLNKPDKHIIHEEMVKQADAICKKIINELSNTNNTNNKIELDKWYKLLDMIKIEETPEYIAEIINESVPTVQAMIFKLFSELDVKHKRYLKTYDTMKEKRCNVSIAKYYIKREYRPNEGIIKGKPKTSKYKGIHFKGDYWTAKIYHRKQIIFIGNYYTEEEAHQAYLDVEKVLKNKKKEIKCQ